MKYTGGIYCGTCGQRAKFHWGETYTMSRSAAAAAVRAGHGERDGSTVTLGEEIFEHAPGAAIWRWKCRGCGADWQAPLDSLEQASGTVVLGIDLG